MSLVHKSMRRTGRALFASASLLVAALPATAETVTVYFGGSFSHGVSGWVQYETQNAVDGVDNSGGNPPFYGERLRYEGVSYSITTAWGTRTGTGGSAQVYNDHGFCVLPTASGCAHEPTLYHDRVDFQWHNDQGEYFQLVALGPGDAGREHEYLDSANLPSLFDQPPTSTLLYTMWNQFDRQMWIDGNVAIAATPFAPPPPIPEPATLWMIGAGLLLLAARRARRSATPREGTVMPA